MQDLLSDTKTAFQYKSTSDLKLAKWIYGIMHHYPDLVVGLSKLGMSAVEWKLPFASNIVHSTFYKVFCGGTDLKDCEPVISNLYNYDVLTVLDYGAEAKDSEEEYEAVANEFLRAIRFAGQNEAIPIISLKITALADFELLEKYSLHDSHKTVEDVASWERVQKRFDEICKAAFDEKVSVFVDAEESWIQGALDELVLTMSKKYNKEHPVIYNTYQMYLKSSLFRLTSHHEELKKDGVLGGAKIVRGAYMEKESERAKELGSENPVQDSKENTDSAYNEAIKYCFDNREEIAFCCASHNRDSSILLLELLKDQKVENHPNISFCQLYGMRDNLTFNLAKHGVRSMKYLPYGSVENTFPYLVRRAQENTSITDDASREYEMISEELRRRESQN